MLVGLPGHPMTNAGGYYEGLVLNGWTGTVTPAKSGFTFDPAARIYDSENPVIGDTPDQYYMVTSAPAFQLAFSQQPSPTVVGTDITPAVTVEIQDEFGNVLGNATNSVTLSLGTNPSGATLSGTVTVDAVEGVAVFSNLKIDKIGTYKLSANSGSLIEADSSSFDITGAVPSKIQVETAADGSGTVVPAQNVRSGFSITAYAISRDAGGNFIANVAAESWSLINKTGGVIDDDLVASEDMKSATFTGTAIGSTVIHAVKTDCTSVDSGVLAVVAAEAWVARYNGPGSGDDGADGIAVDASGNVYVAGFIQVNEIDYDYATIKYDSTGHQLWVARYDGPGNSDDDAMGIAVDSSGNVYVTGMSYGNTTDYDYATIKYDSSGNQLWVARYDGPEHGRDFGMWIAVDPSGNVYVTGESSNGINGDYTTIKYDGNGNQLWVARYDGPGHSTDRAVGIAVDTSGNVYATGSSVGSGTNSDYATIKYASNGSQLWVARYDGPGSGIDSARRVAVDPSGDVYIAGCSAGSGTGYDFATIKYDSNGNRLWVARYNGPANGDDGFNCVSMAFDPSGNIYVLGGSAGSGPGLDYATVKYDSNGNQLWIARYNGPGNGDDEPDRVAVDPLGNAYVAGESTGSGTGYDYATIKYDSNGNQLWVARYNGPGNDSDCGYYNALDSLGNVLVSGSSVGNGTYYDFATIKYAQSFPSTLIITTSALDNGYVGTPYGKDLLAFGGSGPRTWSIVDGSGSLPPGMSLSPSIGIISGTPTTPGTYNFTVQVVDGSLKASKVLSITIQSEVYAFVTKWGSSGSGDGQFSYPYGLAVDSSGNVYVADRDNYRIQKFTSSGVFITKWGSSGSGDGQFNRPYGIAVDSAGNVYVADTENDRIQKFTSSGVFITEWGSFGSGDGQFDGPFGVAIDRLGNVYVAERDNNRVQKFTSSGVFLTKWGSSGSGDGQFIAATGIAIDSSGNVCVADCYNYRIQKFTSSGVFLTKWGSNGSGDSQFYYPSGIAVDSSGSIYVADCNNNRIQKFTSDGVFITKWGSPGSGDGQFQLATGIAVDSSGNVYVADYLNCRIQEFRQK
jgi:DNA-binding beta-propeller fold protein YncE